ncbi:hypothetical protein FHS83_003517 [Rhizomicrobium palustre]|uniref:Uncharacterized protein n=1 Tax=Rhizomicrobium palustre TaxID=189966 RepID=A0A846N3X1_9PROT|nr:hypothetical protein [Rhizomicrobium palustre]
MVLLRWSVAAGGKVKDANGAGAGAVGGAVRAAALTALIAAMSASALAIAAFARATQAAILAWIAASNAASSGESFLAALRLPSGAPGRRLGEAGSAADLAAARGLETVALAAVRAR